MRGIGVLLVVFGHLFRQPSGVFLALDIFFVISGYLIACILLDQQTKLGRIYFVPFYMARARRLMPMAVLTILVTVGLSYYLVNATRGRDVAEDGFWGLVFGINWHFSAEQTDYFNESGQSPLLHYWSLSVEEQFYLLFPSLLAVAFAVAAWRKWSGWGLVTGTLAVTCLASFSYSMWHSAAEPTAAYFSTFDRVWEFGAGALLAAMRPWLRTWSRAFSTVVAWVAVGALVSMVFWIDYGVKFPAPWALVPVVLSGLVIASGVVHRPRVLVIDNPVMKYAGNVSYSMYLVHLPVNVLLLAVMAAKTTTYYVTALALTGVITVACYHLIERPMRRARFLMLPQERAIWPVSDRSRTPQAVGWALVGVTLTACLCVLALRAVPATTTTDVQAQASIKHGDDAAAARLEKRQAELTQSLEMTKFPAFDPPLDTLNFASWASGLRDSGCETADDEFLMCQVTEVRTSRSDKLAVVIGDSLAASWTPGVRAALEPEGWKVQQLTMFQCPSWTFGKYVNREGRNFPECAARHAEIESYITENQPDLVITSTGVAQTQYAELKGSVDTRVSVAEKGLTETIRSIQDDVGRIITLQPPPVVVALVDCVTRFGSPSECVRQPDDRWRDMVAGESAAAEAMGTEYVVTQDWFCVESQCPAFIGVRPMSVDGSHLTIQHSTQLAPLLRDVLLPAEGQQRLREVRTTKTSHGRTTSRTVIPPRRPLTPSETAALAHSEGPL